jgi:long-chain acyl-CoA synthetase
MASAWGSRDLPRSDVSAQLDSPVVSLDPISFQDFNGTTGVPSPSSDIKLLDDDGRDEAEVAAIASEIPGVAECACAGAPDAKTGEAVKRFVVKVPGSQLSVEDVTVHCRKEMTAYKVPKVVRVVDALPKSTVGKILRRELRDIA